MIENPSLALMWHTECTFLVLLVRSEKKRVFISSHELYIELFIRIKHHMGDPLTSLFHNISNNVLLDPINSGGRT